MIEFEMEQLDSIMEYKLGTLWRRAVFGDATLTEDELKKVELAGK